LLGGFPDPLGEEAEAPSPWADFPPEETDRLLLLSIRWGADNAILDDTVALACEHGLVLYDPQGPDVYLPSDPIVEREPYRLGFADYAKPILFVLAGVILFAAGWWLPVPVLNWLLMIAGGFLISVAVFLLAILVFGLRPQRGSAVTPDTRLQRLRPSPSHHGVSYQSFGTSAK
jgi:hypothetical protein